MKVYFYLSPEHWLSPIPTLENISERRKWGAHGWIISTYLILKKTNMDCELTNKVPEEGIVIFHKGFMDENLKPSLKQLFVCIRADWGIHSFAQLHICQNQVQTQNSKNNIALKLLMMNNVHFVHYWAQRNIKPRNSNIPLKLKKISYLGLKDNLAKELKSNDWQQFLTGLDIEWSIRDKHTEWDDYTTTDAVLFCRDFDGKPHHHKPSTKLYNSWIAGSLPIFTPESAYISEIENKPEAAVVVNSYQDLKDKISLLVKNPDKYSTLVTNGKLLASNYSEEKIASEWIGMIEKLKIEFIKQQKQPYKHILFLFIRHTFHFIRKSLQHNNNK